MFKIITDKLDEFSTWFAIKTVEWLSTMACVMLFLVWSLIPLLYPPAENAVAYVSADILQLVLLPLIMLGQKLASDMSAENHAKLADRHEEIADTLSALHMIAKEHDEELDVLKTLLSNQEKILAQQFEILSRLS